MGGGLHSRIQFVAFTRVFVILPYMKRVTFRCYSFLERNIPSTARNGWRVGDQVFEAHDCVPMEELPHRSRPLPPSDPGSTVDDYSFMLPFVVTRDVDPVSDQRSRGFR